MSTEAVVAESPRHLARWKGERRRPRPPAGPSCSPSTGRGSRSRASSPPPLCSSSSAPGLASGASSSAAAKVGVVLVLSSCPDTIPCLTESRTLLQVHVSPCYVV